MLYEESEEEVTIVNTAIDGTDEVIPTIYTITSFNPLGPRYNGIIPSILVSGWKAHTLFSATSLSEALAFGRSPTAQRAFLKSKPVEGVYHSDINFQDMYDQRRECIANLVTTKQAHWLLHLYSEFAMHAAFILSTIVMLGTPVYEYYNQGNFCYYGSGFDCSNGNGSGHSYTRLAITTLCAIYTGIYFLGFLRNFRFRDGFPRYIVLFYSFLFVLPFTSFLELIIIFLTHMEKGGLIGAITQDCLDFNTKRIDEEVMPLLIRMNHNE